MCEPQTTLIERQMPPSDGIRTLTIPRPESTLTETLTLGNGVAYSTGVPVTVAPESKSSSPGSGYVGAILSGVVVVVVLLLVIWVAGVRVTLAQVVGKGQGAQAVAQLVPGALAAQLVVVLAPWSAIWPKTGGKRDQQDQQDQWGQWDLCLEWLRLPRSLDDGRVWARPGLASGWAVVVLPQ
ncbi:hypothetical protein F5Y10DRAFT_271890 [Nemania abortiva]|nr:hypothetical protein F5Y10DRAFT_271890 [Nemania abortiva]